jgi:hypothetical protein
MKRIIPYLLIFLSACKAELPKVPDNVIPMNKMESILADMHITDAVAETKAQMGMNEKLLAQEYHEQIFKNHGTTREEFLKSYKFYEANPVLLNKMYDHILDSLSKREEAVGKK